MSSDKNPIYSGGLRPTYDNALEQSGLLGAHRRCTNVNRYEVIFLITALLAALVTDSLTIYRIVTVPDKADSDVVYGIIILVTSAFLLIFLSTGILQQRITDIIVFFVCALMMTIYVIAHYVYRWHIPSKNETPTDRSIRTIRLILTCVFNLLFIPLSIIVIRDYERDEFGKRLFGAFPAQRWPLRCYNVLDCMARINTMFAISVFLLNLYNFNDYEIYDTILLAAGIPICFIWLGVTIGMIRLENYALVGIFGVISLFQPAFLIYCLYSDISDPSNPDSSPTTPMFFNSTTTPIFSNSTVSTMFSSTKASTSASVPIALYVCIGFNMLTHLASIICASLCVKNFKKGLKEKVFNNKIDRWFQIRLGSG